MQVCSGSKLLTCRHHQPLRHLHKTNGDAINEEYSFGGILLCNGDHTLTQTVMGKVPVSKLSFPLKRVD